VELKTEVAELAGKSAVVTGATGGIGFHSARLLALAGAEVLITGRDPQRGADAVQKIRAETGDQRVEFVSVDHSTVAANQTFAATVSERFEHLDVLVNNVGGAFAKRQLTADGYELSLALNFLAPFVLTEELLPSLTTGSSPVRCINVVSSAFQMTKGDPLDDIQSEQRYVGIEAHARAKLFALLWTLGLSRRTSQTDVTVTAVNPGMAWTPMTAALTPETVPAWRYIFPVVRFFQRRADPVRAAQNCTALAFAPSLAVAGRYFDGRKPGRIPARLSDPSLVDRVQALGEQLRLPLPAARNAL